MGSEMYHQEMTVQSVFLLKIHETVIKFFACAVAFTH